jgi:hypothetical protein
VSQVPDLHALSAKSCTRKKELGDTLPVDIQQKQINFAPIY